MELIERTIVNFPDGQKRNSVIFSRELKINHIFGKYHFNRNRYFIAEITTDQKEIWLELYTG